MKHMEQYGKSWKEPSWAFWKRIAFKHADNAKRKTILWKKWRREARKWGAAWREEYKRVVYYCDNYKWWKDQAFEQQRMYIESNRIKTIWMIYFCLLTAEIMILFLNI